MEGTTASRFDPRAVLAVVGLVFVVATVWAVAALASGGSSGTPDLPAGSLGGDPSSVFVQDSNGDDTAPSRDDCPERDGAGGGSTPSDGANSAGDAL